MQPPQCDQSKKDQDFLSGSGETQEAGDCLYLTKEYFTRKKSAQLRVLNFSFPAKEINAV